MSVTARALTQSALLYPHDIRFSPPTLLLLRLAQAQYRAAPFLDDRVVEAAEPVGWVPLEPVETAARAIRPLPFSFIFHIGHVGSTLLSRLLDEVPGVLGLREPLPLRRLAQQDDRHQRARWLQVLLPLWGRGFPGSTRIIVKATSSAGVLAPELMAALPASRAIYLHMRPEPFLSVLLAGEATRGDLENMTHARLARLRETLGEDLEQGRALTLGEGAAVAWLAGRLDEQYAAAAAGDRLLQVDFDDMLADVRGTLARILAHLDLPEAFSEILARSPSLARYSKLGGEHPYSPQLRRQVMDQARAQSGEEIALGLALIERLASRHAAVAALLT